MKSYKARDKFAVWLANLVLRVFATKQYRARLAFVVELGFRELDRRKEELEKLDRASE